MHLIGPTLDARRSKSTPNWIITVELKSSNDVLTLGVEGEDEAIAWQAAINQSRYV